MRLATLFPFAALGVLVVVVSSAALLSSTRESGIGGPVAEPSFAATTGKPRAVPELSKTARLAYWREGRLWVAGLDGSLRRAIAPVDDPRRISDLLWSPDGESLAYIDAGQSVVVIRMDGERWDASLPLIVRDQGWRISDLRWSPTSLRIAATFLRPGDGRADVFVTDLTRPIATWTRVTAMDDVFAGDWISDTEILASTGAGVIAVVGIPNDLQGPGQGPTSDIRPISGALGASPILASDGRVHFLAGRIPTSRDPSLPYVTASRASIWSAALDGSDVKRETLTELNDVRLDTRLPDGRYLVHRGGTNAQSITGEDIEPLPANAGIIERVKLAPDGRTAYGFTRERVVQLDLARVGLTPPASPEPQVTVYLDTSGDADIWFPAPPITPARGEDTIPEGPSARYAFVLGGHLWQMAPDGKASILRAGQALRRTTLPLPHWSPTGAHLLAVEQAGLGAPTTALIAVVVDADGEQSRLADTYAASRSYAWSPDGKEIAIVVDKRGVNGLASNAQLEVRFMDPRGAGTRLPVSGNEVAWTSQGVLVLVEDSGRPLVQLRADGANPRTLVERAKLITDERISTTPWLGGAWAGLDARADGSWISLRLTTANGDDGYLVLIDRSGAAADFIPLDGLTDVRWSPAKPLLGYTLDFRAINERAVIHDPASGALTFQPGRFAGWSPDGEWYYVARTTGLFAYPLTGGSGVRVASVGTPAAITLP